VSGVDLVQLVRRLARQEVAPALAMVQDGIVEAVEDGKASVRLGGPSADPVSGYSYSPSLDVQPGDHVLVYRLGGYQLVLEVLNRNAVLGSGGGGTSTGGTPAAVPTRTVYSASATWTKPALARYVEVELVGGGGGAGGSPTSATGQGAAGGGGASGGYGRAIYDAAALPATCAVTVGGAGAGGVAGADGSTGGASSFAGAGITSLVGNGGLGGAGGTASGTALITAGGVGGSASGPAGAVAVPGRTGGSSIVRGGLVNTTGLGAPSQLGGGGGQHPTVSGDGLAGTGYGAGGSGGYNAGAQATARDGGPGTAGAVIVTVYY
jgi:hypothetical protein